MKKFLISFLVVLFGAVTLNAQNTTKSVKKVADLKKDESPFSGSLTLENLHYGEDNRFQTNFYPTLSYKDKREITYSLGAEISLYTNDAWEDDSREEIKTNNITQYGEKKNSDREITNLTFGASKNLWKNQSGMSLETSGKLYFTFLSTNDGAFKKKEMLFRHNISLSQEFGKSNISASLCNDFYTDPKTYERSFLYAYHLSPKLTYSYNLTDSFKLSTSLLQELHYKNDEEDSYATKGYLKMAYTYKKITVKPYVRFTASDYKFNDGEILKNPLYALNLEFSL